MRSLGLALAAASLYPAAVSAEAPTIQHTAVKCIVAGKYPKLEASFVPGPIARARSYFRPEGVPSWYYVEMTKEPAGASAFAGVLPKPTKTLVGQRIDYYLEAASASFDTGRTLEYAPEVVAREQDCKEQPVAAYAPGPPAGVFPNVPQGFAVAGGVPVAAVAIVGGGAAAATTVIVTRDDDQPTTTPTTMRPIPDPTPPPPTAPPPTLGGFQISCQAQPRQGVVPLRVLFGATASGGTGVYDFVWAFGDGETSTQVSPGHTYTRAGTYEAVVTVTSGAASARCGRTIVADPLITDHDLTVVKTGTGAGTVTGPGIDCGSDCLETFADGAQVDLVATPAGGSTFDGFGGDCSGTTCRVQMSQARTVTAAFNVVPVLNVSRAGTGAGFAAVTGPGINCGTDCTEVYPFGTNVSLQPSPLPSAPPLEFVGWSGDCSGATCNVLMNGAKSVVATWERLFLLEVKIDTFRGHVESDDGGIDCGGDGNVDCDEDYRSGTTVTLRGEGNPDFFFIRWGTESDCAAFGTNPVCTLSMTADRFVDAVFSGTPLRSAGGSGAPALGAELRWSSQLDVAGGWGRVTSNGADVGAASAGVSPLAIGARSGPNRVEAELGGSSGKPGTWRFELLDRGRLEPGSLRVLEGQVLLVTEEAVVFRLEGRPGERVAFTFRTGN